MNFKNEPKMLGSFECGSAMRVTDPCYEPEIWCAGTVNAVAGRWECGIIELDGAVAVLAARHENCPLPLTAKTINTGADFRSGDSLAAWTRPAFRPCVDSGQAGFFDDAAYRARNGRADESWYKKICDMTCGEAKGGTLADGVASRAGYGDGDYLCVYHKNEAGLADFIYLMFMDDEGNEDW